MKLSVDFPPELVDAVAERVVCSTSVSRLKLTRAERAERGRALVLPAVAAVCARIGPASPVEKDGSRLLFRRSDLDAFVRRGGAKRP